MRIQLALTTISPTANSPVAYSTVGAAPLSSFGTWMLSG
jgi:hypothetical protein